jgi:hypothetical protein
VAAIVAGGALAAGGISRVAVVLAVGNAALLLDTWAADVSFVSGACDSCFVLEASGVAGAVLVGLSLFGAATGVSTAAGFFLANGFQNAI